MDSTGPKALWPFVLVAGGDSPEAACSASPGTALRLNHATLHIHTPQLHVELAHKFYKETIVTKNVQKWAKLRWMHKSLIPQGIVKLDPPHIHVDFPVVLYEV